MGASRQMFGSGRGMMISLVASLVIAGYFGISSLFGHHSRPSNPGSGDRGTVERALTETAVELTQQASLVGGDYSALTPDQITAATTQSQLAALAGGDPTRPLSVSVGWTAPADFCVQATSGTVTEHSTASGGTAAGPCPGAP